jgi:hypothetical protein
LRFEQRLTPGADHETKEHRGHRGLGRWTFQNMTDVDEVADSAMRERNPRSISDPQEVLPLSKVALEADALRDLERRDHAALHLLSALSGALHVQNGHPYELGACEPEPFLPLGLPLRA